MPDSSSACDAMTGVIRRGDDAYSRHRRQVECLVKYYNHKIPDLAQAKLNALEKEGRTIKTESDVLRERHRFIWPDDPLNLTEEDLLAKKAYDRLFKEYALVNLKHFKSGRIALRWRNESEVVRGIGEFTCAGLRCPYHLAVPSEHTSQPGLKAYEVNFGYIEHGVKHNELVKVMCCPQCARKISYRPDGGVTFPPKV